MVVGRSRLVGIMCETCHSTATRAIRALRPWFWALPSQLAPLGVPVRLTWCVITVDAKAIISAIVGSCTVSLLPTAGRLPPLPSRQKTEAW